MSEDNYGPLPRSERSAELQRETFKALDRLLPSTDFVLRPETQEDAGIDAALELVLGGCYSGFRAHLQLKGTDSVTTNADGSYSLQVASSNLNYLLNSDSPLYVLYRASADELRYVWAWDEFRRLESENAQWTAQQTVTIRFSEILDATALQVIRERILAEARLRRTVQNRLALAALSETLVVAIDPATLRITDPAMIVERLLSSGITIVSSGHAVEVLDQIGTVGPAAARLPRIQLVAAYAHWALGRYMAALGQIQEASLGFDELPEADRPFALHLRDACELAAGLIDVRELTRRSEDWGPYASSEFALASNLVRAYHEWLRDFGGDPSSLGALPAAAEAVFSRLDVSAPIRIQAQLYMLHAEGARAEAQGFLEWCDVAMRQGLGITPTVTEGLAEHAARRAQWETRAIEALAAATNTNNPLLLAGAYEAVAGGRAARLLFARVFRAWPGQGAQEPDREMLYATMRLLNDALDIYSRVGNTDGQCRVRLLLAELFLVAEQPAAARNLAEGVLPIATALRYQQAVARASELLSGESPITAIERTLERLAPEHADEQWATMSDDDIATFAAEVTRVAGLPMERADVVARDVAAQRQIARERLAWCRHINLIADLTHTRHPSTHFATDPPRDCECRHLGYRSAYWTPDSSVVIERFKVDFCAGCESQSPARLSSTTSESQ